MRYHAPTLAILAALLGACAQDAPMPTGPPDPAPDATAAAQSLPQAGAGLDAAEAGTVRIMLADVADRLLPALDDAAADALRAPLALLVESLGAGKTGEAARALARARTALAGVRTRADLREFSGPDLDVIDLVLVDAATLLLDDRARDDPRQ